MQLCQKMKMIKVSHLKTQIQILVVRIIHKIVVQITKKMKMNYLLDHHHNHNHSLIFKVSKIPK